MRAIPIRPAAVMAALAKASDPFAPHFRFMEPSRKVRLFFIYIKRLLENSRGLRHLRDHHGEFLAEFEAIAAAETV